MYKRQLDANIGRGSQGKVYKIARREDIDDVFALKSFNCPVDRRREESFLKTVNHAGGHTHIVKPVRYITQGIVLPFFPGGDLFDYVKNKGVLSEHKVAEWMAKISSAVAYLHRNDIAHMDLKLDNVLLDSKEEPHLSDFGLAFAIPSHGMSRLRSGTLDYRAPELAFEGWFRSRAADVWSLGICAYALCTGTFPGDEKAVLEVCAKVKDGSILANRHHHRAFTRDFLAILDRCLQIKPEKRSSADEVCRLWQEFLDPTSHTAKENDTNDTSDPNDAPTANLVKLSSLLVKENDATATVKEFLDPTAHPAKENDTSGPNKTPTAVLVKENDATTTATAPSTP